MRQLYIHARVAHPLCSTTRLWAYSMIIPLVLPVCSRLLPRTRLQALTSKEKIANMKAAMPASVAKAMGRISTGLYIVTAAQENARRCAQCLC